MSCNQNQLPRPVRGNAFNIAVKVVARRLDGTVIDDFELSSEDVLNIVYRGTLTPTAFTIEDNNVALIHFDGTQAVGMYGVDFSGVWEGEPWRFALPIIFQVVDQTSQGWLPKDGIIVDPTYEVEAAITIATVGSTVQSDWDENDPTNPAYIKNKPTVYTQQQTDALVALERQARQQADTTLDGKITANTNAIGAEETRAKGAEQGLQTAIGAEETRAKGAEQGLQTAIGAEETRAKAAEKQNADDIDGIEAVIPAQASAQNQLADKNFVNSSISTNTANFVGTYNSLVELQAVQNPTNNDYGFVIEQDAAGNEYYDRYKYVASSQQWLFEYKVESTPFTAAQWAAIQSGITSALVTKLTDLPTNAELQQALTLINNTLAGKANSADIPTSLSQLSQDVTHRVVSDAEKATWNGKQAALVSGTNIKTINNESLLGEGNISVAAELPSNTAYLSPDSGDGIVPDDGIRAVTVTSAAAMTISPDVVTVIDGAVGTAAITLQVPQDNLAHVWDILMTTDSSVAITFAMSNSETILYPSGFSVGASKAVEVSVIGVGETYYLRYGEFA